jgi:hypothetical protein
MMKIEGLRELNRKLQNMTDKLPNSAAFVFGKEGRRVAGNIQEAIRDAPRVDLGTLERGIGETTKRTRAGAETIVKPSSAADKYAIFVEKDTRPHWPPIAAITPWANRHGIEPFLVARAISKHGTKGIHMFENEFNALARRGDRLANDLGIQMIRNFERG